MHRKSQNILSTITGIIGCSILMYIGVNLPILGIVMAFPFYFMARRKHSILLASILLGVMVGLLAYNFVPQDNYDLVRHWQVVKAFEGVTSIERFTEVAPKIELEILPQLFSWLIARIGDYNLLQFFPVAIGYTALFYMLADYRQGSNLGFLKFGGLVILVMFGQSMLFYFSGLYNYFAINIFALAAYLDYVKKKKKIAYMLYAASPFLHSSLLLPLGLMIILKIKKNKLSLKFLVLFLVAMLSFGTLLAFVADTLNIGFLNDISRVYTNYTTGNARFLSLYTGGYLFMSITKTLFTFVLLWRQRNNSKNVNLRNLILLTAGTVIVLSMSSITMTRFTSLLLFLSIPVAIDSLSREDKDAKYLSVMTWALGISYAIYSIYQVAPLIGR